MTIRHCPNGHEPVVTNRFCIYCGLELIQEFDNIRLNHDSGKCDQCFQVPTTWDAVNK